MRRMGTVILVCAATIGGRGIAQTPSTVSAEIGKALATEWKDPALYPEPVLTVPVAGPPATSLVVGPDQTDGITHCLNALARYTELLPAQSELDMALQELALAIPAQRAVTLLGWAKDLNIDVATTLAQASTSTLDKNNTAAVTLAFARANAGIEAAFRNSDTHIAERLKNYVNTQIKAGNYPRALYELLHLTYDFRTNLFPAAANCFQKAAALMEVYRMCYANDPDKLFKLVSNTLK